MPKLDDLVMAPRKVMTLFFVIDTSGSMGGEKIGTVNAAIEETIPELYKLSSTNADAEIKVAVLQFSSGATWLTPDGPVTLENYSWNDLHAGGVTDLGEACLELYNKMSRKAFLASQTGAFAPVVLLLSDGGPTDNYKKGLERLKTNLWFKNAIRIAIAIGHDADKEVLKEFTGTPEGVIEANDKETLHKLIRIASIASSTLQSSSKPVIDSEDEIVSDEEAAQKATIGLVEKLKDEVVPQETKVDDEWSDW